MNGPDREQERERDRDRDRERDRERERDRDLLRDFGLTERRRGHELTSDNLADFDWKHRRRIVVKRCILPVDKSCLNQCKRSLTSLSFRLMVTRVNLMAFLNIGHNLTQLVFENVLLDEYKPLSIQRSSSHTANKEPSVSSSSSRKLRKRGHSQGHSQGQTQGQNSTPISTGNESGSPLELPNLKELYFSAANGLTKNDYNLLEFFLRAVTTRKLEYFEFIGNARAFRDLTEPEANPVSQLYGQNDRNSNIVARFLIKNRPSLKFIVIGGSGFRMYNNDLKMTQGQGQHGQPNEQILPLLTPVEMEELKKLKLTGLDVAIDDDGIDLIMANQQNSLTSLVVTAITFGIPENTPLLLSNILQCCTNNFETLVEFYFKPKLISQKSRHLILREKVKCRHNNNKDEFVPRTTTNTNNNSNNDNNMSSCSSSGCCTLLDTFTIDCSIFSSCPSLRYLTLSLNILTSEDGIIHGWPDENFTSCTVQGVTLKNIQRLPKGLKSLHLDAEQFSVIELELLANQFFKFNQLREFSFRARWNNHNYHHHHNIHFNNLSNIRFLVRIQWIWVLFQHSRMTKVTFEGGVLDDLDGTQEFINGRSERDISVMIDERRICFEKINE